MTLFHRRAVAAALLPLLAVLAGCGSGNPKTYPIPGRLVYRDGQPVPGATVVLQTTQGDKQLTARGMVRTDGTFDLTTFAEGDGAVEGEHRVTVIPIPSADGPKVATVVPAKYADPDQSKLTVSIAPGTPEIRITIDPPGKR